MIVAFVGNDGTGKTSLGKGLYSLLLELGVAASYREEFRYFLLSYIFRILGGKISKLRSEFLSKDNKHRRIFGLWPYAVLVDQLLLLAYLRIRKRKEVTILDRYVYDFLISWEWLGYSNKLIRYLYKRFPRPDLVILCDASPETSYERKKETHQYSMEYYRIQRARYLNLAKDLGIPVLNT
ncbi:MAG: hypothetical protein QI197_03475, partial [Candidatus Korarchaeota archaeon]|nr:hypothetical protein [Candidatus Korarchaeota archaeon]